MEETQTTLETELEVDPLVEGDRSEENRITEAEKNERQRKMLQVLMQWLMNFFEYESSKSISIQFFCLPIQTLHFQWSDWSFGSEDKKF